MGMQAMYIEDTKRFLTLLLFCVIIISMGFSNYFLYYRYVYDNFNKNYKYIYIINIKNNIIKMESNCNKMCGNPDIYLYVMPVINESNLISNNQILLMIYPRGAIDISGVKLNVSLVTRNHSAPNYIKLLKIYDKKLSYEPIIKVYKINALLKIKISQYKSLKIIIYTKAYFPTSKAFVKLSKISPKLINNTIYLDLNLVIFDNQTLWVLSALMYLIGFIIIFKYTINKEYLNSPINTYFRESYKIVIIFIISSSLTLLKFLNNKIFINLNLFLYSIIVYAVSLIVFTEMIIYLLPNLDLKEFKTKKITIFFINTIEVIVIFSSIFFYLNYTLKDYSVMLFNVIVQAKMLLVSVGLPHLYSFFYNLMYIIIMDEHDKVS